MVLTLVSKELFISKKSHAVNVILYCFSCNEKSLISFRTQSCSKVDRRRLSIPNPFKFKATLPRHSLLKIPNCSGFLLPKQDNLLNFVECCVFSINLLIYSPILSISRWVSVHSQHIKMN